MKSKYEDFKTIRLEELSNMPPHKDYEPISGIYIPFGDVVTVRECSQDEYKTKGGIIMGGGEHMEHCKIGYIINLGEECRLPVKAGDTIAFDRSCSFGFNFDGNNYLRVPSFQVFFRIPPDTYLEPHYADFFEKRRKSRNAGGKVVKKREDNELGEKFERRDEENKKKDYIEGKEGKGRIIIK